MMSPRAPAAEPDAAGVGPLREERGQILVLVAIFMFLLMALGGLFIDASLLFLADRSTQHLADSAALSGAGAHVAEPALRHGTAVTPDPALVQQRACAVLLSHPAISACPVAGVATVTVLPTNQIQVDVVIPVPLTFLRVLGVTAGNARARATVDLYVDPHTATDPANKLPERRN